MPSDKSSKVRNQIGRRVAELRESGHLLSPLDLHARMDAIRQLACDNGLAGVENLARCSAQLALLPGHRIAVRSCLEHVEDAFESRTQQDYTAILAALAVRLH